RQGVFPARFFELDAFGKQYAALPEGFLHADSCSADKDRLDFARVLIATPDLEIVKRVENVLVDGLLVEVKIVEEWGYALGEDT
ncbi:sulfate transporter, partial [Trifolium medium]|nr:sulfate transporter [Trifolium medium]